MIYSIMYLASGGGDGDYRQLSISVQPVRSLSFVEIQYAIKGFDNELIIGKVYKVAVLDYVHLLKIGIGVSYIAKNVDQVSRVRFLRGLPSWPPRFLRGLSRRCLARGGLEFESHPRLLPLQAE
ncbi:hypothetical protein Tco_0579663 [Tanacetum coccineum]